jgi:hypothetical protein
VVELRESRDAVALLPTLRDNLEKVGFTIDHTVKQESSLPREIATELTLRYRLDSPQLPAISDALDALQLNPRTTVIEPEPDTTERRQLATAQEQLRQAGPKLVPSDSPAPDAAKDVGDFQQLL